MDVISLIASALAVALVILREYFDHKRRQRETAERVAAVQAKEDALVAAVQARIMASARREGVGAIEVEDELERRAYGSTETNE